MKPSVLYLLLNEGMLECIRMFDNIIFKSGKTKESLKHE